MGKVEVRHATRLALSEEQMLKQQMMLGRELSQLSEVWGIKGLPSYKGSILNPPFCARQTRCQALPMCHLYITTYTVLCCA